MNPGGTGWLWRRLLVWQVGTEADRLLVPSVLSGEDLSVLVAEVTVVDWGEAVEIAVRLVSILVLLFVVSSYGGLQRFKL